MEGGSGGRWWRAVVLAVVVVMVLVMVVVMKAIVQTTMGDVFFFPVGYGWLPRPAKTCGNAINPLMAIYMRICENTDQ